MATTRKKNIIILKNIISSKQKKIFQLLLSPVETIIEIRKNQYFFKITFFVPTEIRGNPILKSNVILAGDGF